MPNDEYGKMLELLSIVATCIFGVLALKGKGRWQAAFLALFILLGAAALLTKSPFVGFAVLVTFGFGVGLFTATRIRSSPVVFARRQASLRDEVAPSKKLWAAWHTGMIVGADREVLNAQKISRLIVSAPDSAALAELEKITDLSRAAFAPGIRELTNAAKRVGGEVKWFDGPIQNSTIIADPDESHGWARVELLLPFTAPALRPSIKVFKNTDPELFNVIRTAYEKLWNDQHSTAK